MITVTTRPSYDDTTWYLSHWAEKLISFARNKGLKVVDLDKNRANRKELRSLLKKRDVRFIVFNGHGNNSRICGDNGEVIMDVNDAKVTDGKLVYARACDSTKILGKSCIDNGCAAYIGYDESFIFMYDPNKMSHPNSDDTAALFLEPSNYVAISLFKGHTAGDANQKSRGMFARNIGKLLTAGRSSENYEAIRYLYWDLQHQVCLGDRNARI